MLKTNPQSHDKKENAEKAIIDSSSDRKRDPSTDRSSAIKSVALWVSSGHFIRSLIYVKEGSFHDPRFIDISLFIC